MPRDLDVVDVPLIDQDVRLNTTSPLLQRRPVFPHVAARFRQHRHFDRLAFSFERLRELLRPDRRPVADAESPRNRITDHQQALDPGTPGPGVESVPLFVRDKEVFEPTASRSGKCGLALIAIDHPQRSFAAGKEDQD